MAKLIVSHNVDGLVSKRYMSRDAAIRAANRKRLSTYQRVQVVDAGEIVHSRGYASPARAAIEHPSFAL